MSYRLLLTICFGLAKRVTIIVTNQQMESSGDLRLAANENIAVNSVKQHKRSVQYENSVTSEPLTKTTNYDNQNGFESKRLQGISWTSAVPQVNNEMSFLGARFTH